MHLKSHWLKNILTSKYETFSLTRVSSGNLLTPENSYRVNFSANHLYERPACADRTAKDPIVWKRHENSWTGAFAATLLYWRVLFRASAGHDQPDTDEKNGWTHQKGTSRGHVFVFPDRKKQCEERRTNVVLDTLSNGAHSLSTHTFHSAVFADVSCRS